MTKFGNLLLGAAVGVGALAAVATGANAAIILTEGTGWQYGQDNAINTPNAGGAITFTADAGGDLFSFTDGFLAGDVYKITISAGPFSVTTPSTFTSYTTSFNNNSGPFASTFAGPWLSNTYSHFQAIFAPGTYSIVVRDTSKVGYPAGFGFRLDDVPEPASWALMLVGFGGLGYALRSRRKLAKARI